MCIAIYLYSYAQTEYLSSYRQTEYLPPAWKNYRPLITALKSSSAAFTGGCMACKYTLLAAAVVGRERPCFPARSRASLV